MYGGGIITQAILRRARRHYALVANQYPERKKRPWELVRWELESAWKDENLNKVFDDKYIDDVKDIIKQDEKTVSYMIALFCLITSVVYFILMDQSAAVSIFGLTVKENDGSIVIAIGVAALIMFNISNKIVRITSYHWILESYAHYLIPRSAKLIDLRSFLRNIYLARFGLDIFGPIADRHTIKVKYDISPRPVFRLVAHVEEIIALIVFITMTYFWLHITYTILTSIDFIIAIKLISISVIWMSIGYCFLSLVMCYSIVTAVLAKGREQENTNERHGEAVGDPS